MAENETPPPSGGHQTKWGVARQSHLNGQREIKSSLCRIHASAVQKLKFRKLIFFIFLPSVMLTM